MIFQIINISLEIIFIHLLSELDNKYNELNFQKHEINEIDKKWRIAKKELNDKQIENNCFGNSFFCCYLFC